MTHDPFMSAAVLARICDGIATHGVPPLMMTLADALNLLCVEIYSAAGVLERRGLLRRTPDGSAFCWAPTDDGWRAAGYEPPAYVRTK